MLTRASAFERNNLINKFQQLYDETHQRDDPSDSEKDDRKMVRLLDKKERELKKKLSIKRMLRYGEKLKIIELRFGEYGSSVPIGLSYTKISSKLFIRRPTVVQQCRRYL